MNAEISLLYGLRSHTTPHWQTDLSNVITFKDITERKSTTQIWQHQTTSLSSKMSARVYVSGRADYSFHNRMCFKDNSQGFYFHHVSGKPSRAQRFVVILQDQSDGRSPERNLPFNMNSSSVGQQKDISRAWKKGGLGKKERSTWGLHQTTDVTQSKAVKAETPPSQQSKQA